jgi:glycine cleavage system protein P-like pyridoxal-binding family
MEQSINERAMYFTLLVEALLRGESTESLGHVTETTVVDAMYALRAAIERDEQRQREAASA